MGGCLFCKIVRSEIPSKKAYEDDHIFAFHDIQPQAPVHILFITKIHREHLMDLKEEEAAFLTGRLFAAIRKTASDQGLDSKGFRVVTNNGAEAGQSVFHLHFHLLAGRPMSWPPG